MNKHPNGETKIAKLTNGMEVIYDDYHDHWRNPLEVQSYIGNDEYLYMRFGLLVRYAEHQVITPIKEEHILFTYDAGEDIIDKRRSFLEKMSFTLEQEKARDQGMNVVSPSNMQH